MAGTDLLHNVVEGKGVLLWRCRLSHMPHNFSRPTPGMVSVAAAWRRWPSRWRSVSSPPPRQEVKVLDVKEARPLQTALALCTWNMHRT